MVEPNDSNALATSIMRFLSDEDLASRCAANALRYAREHFCFDRMIRAKLDVDLALIHASARSIEPALTPAAAAELVSSDR